MKKYKVVVCGGTFDLLHKGHKEFLKYAFSEGEKVVIGLTSDKYVTQFKESFDVESFEKRKSELKTFLEIEGFSNCEVVSIDDMYGLTLSTEYPYEAIVVTDDTKKNADKINEDRKKRNLKPLEILIFEKILAEDNGPINSTRIRKGQINREGMLYINPKWKNTTLILPESLREELKSPWGLLIDDFQKWLEVNGEALDNKNVITVGDVITRTFNSFKFDQILSVIDFIVARKKQFTEISDLKFDNNVKVISIKNPSGSITNDLISSVDDFFKSNDRQKTVIVIDGEEDLAVLPIILAAPLNFTIFYGQPNQGAVKIDISESNKEKAYGLLNKFSVEKMV